MEHWAFDLVIHNHEHERKLNEDDEERTDPHVHDFLVVHVYTSQIAFDLFQLVRINE